MKRTAPMFATEAALCAAFIEWAKPQGWTAYAETADWDILLVGGNGDQIGIQAKLTLNMKALTQTLPSWVEATGPDYRAILAGSVVSGGRELCRSLGLGLFAPCGDTGFLQPLPHYEKDFITIGGSGIGYTMYAAEPWHYWCPEQRHPLPEYVPDVPAGASGPVQLTKWKIQALKLCAQLERDGFVTPADFRHLRLDRRVWTCPLRGYLIPGSIGGQWVRGPNLRFPEQHPSVFAQILAEITKVAA